MQKMRGRGVIFCFSAIFIISLAGCGRLEKEPYRPVSNGLVSKELLEAADLELLWQIELPIKARENLAELYLLADQIYVLSDRNYLVAMDRHNGRPVFSGPFGEAGLPVLGLELYDSDKLFGIVGNELVEVNSQSGSVIDRQRIAFTAETPAVRNNFYYYVAGNDRRLHALRLADKIHIFEAAPRNDSLITSVVADDDSVIFATDMGNVVSIRPDGPTRLWRFDAAGSITSQIVRDGNYLYLASKDTNVYKLDARTGELLWKYQTPAQLDEAPQVSANAVYQRVRDKGLTALSKTGGRFLWHVRDGIGLLAEAGNKAYIITSDGTLVVMDNQKCRQLYSVNFTGVSKFVTNFTDSKIYIADKFSRVACLKPIK